MEDLWQKILKVLTVIALLLGSSDFSEMAREMLKARVKKKVQEFQERVKP